MRWRVFNRLSLALLMALSWSGAAGAEELRPRERMPVVASFSILGDFVQEVGGDRVELSTLVGINGDVHVYTPTPADAQKIAGARLVVINGLGLEGWLPRLVQSAGSKAAIVTASAGIPRLETDGKVDPHGWQSVANASAAPIRRKQMPTALMLHAIWPNWMGSIGKCAKPSREFPRRVAR